jgi:hypothetical protein
MRVPMTPWTFVLIGGLMTFAGGIMATYGWSQLKQREEAFSLSVPPSIDVSVKPNDKTQIQDLIFRNTGQHVLKEVTVWSILYNVKADEIKSRSAPGGGVLIADKWDSRKEITVQSDKFTFWKVASRTEANEYRCIALVTVYRRETDNRRFVDIDLFLVENIEGRQVLFPFLGGASAGPMQKMIKVFKEIIESEKFIFKVG